MFGKPDFTCRHSPHPGGPRPRRASGEPRFVVAWLGAATSFPPGWPGRQMVPGPVSMYFDAGCGPCTFWAHLTRGLRPGRLDAFALDSPEADHTLVGLPPEIRHDYFHILEGGRLWTGPDAMPVWVGLFWGPSARRIAERVGPLDHSLRFVYNLFWEYRRTRGCAADSISHA